MKKLFETKSPKHTLAIPLSVALVALSACRPNPAADTPTDQAKSGASTEQQMRMELMRSKGTEASLTILPVRLAGKPFDRVTEVVGLLLERQGLKQIELGKTAFGSTNKTEMEDLTL